MENSLVSLQLGRFFKNVRLDRYERITQVTEVYHLIEHSALDKVDVRFTRSVSIQALGGVNEYIPLGIYSARLEHGIYVSVPAELRPRGISSPVQVPLHLPEFPLLLKYNEGRMPEAVDAFIYDPGALAEADRAAREHAAKFPQDEGQGRTPRPPLAPGPSEGE